MPRAGLGVEDGIVVDQRLRTSDPAVYAAGDVARLPDPRSGERIRIGHWAVACRQGRTAARNILGHDDAFEDPPFFWTRQFERSVMYVGHAEEWDEVSRQGECEADSCTVRYLRAGETAAVATPGRSGASLEAEVAWESSLRDAKGGPPPST